MNDSHLTLRIPEDLAAALERRAEERGVPKSMVVREAVSQYLAAPLAQTQSRKEPLLGRELARIWDSGAHLTPEEAEEFERDLRAQRDALPPLDDPWD